MKQVKVKDWLKALRSGKYLQGSGALKNRFNNQTRHCCLGVLCELAGLSERFDENINAYTFGKTKQDELPAIHLLEDLPKRMRYTTDGGLKSILVIDPSYHLSDVNITYFNDYTITVHEMNDLGYTFNEIADAVERTIKFLNDRKRKA